MKRGTSLWRRDSIVVFNLGIVHLLILNAKTEGLGEIHKVLKVYNLFQM